MPFANSEARKKYRAEWYAKHKGKAIKEAVAWKKTNAGSVARTHERYVAKPGVKERISEYNRKRHEARLMARGATRPRPDTCEVCGGQPRKNRAIAFDHCHATGLFRGWLCHECNLILGYAKDNPGLLRMLADYLEEFRSRQP